MKAFPWLANESSEGIALDPSSLPTSDMDALKPFDPEEDSWINTK